MKQALTALIRDTFAGKSASVKQNERQAESHTASAIRTLDLAELRLVSGGDGGGSEISSPKRGW